LFYFFNCIIIIISNSAYNLASVDNLGKYSFIVGIGNNITETPSLFYVKSNSEQFIIPVFNIVIKVKEGNIIDIVW